MMGQIETQAPQVCGRLPPHLGLMSLNQKKTFSQQPQEAEHLVLMQSTGDLGRLSAEPRSVVRLSTGEWDTERCPCAATATRAAISSSCRLTGEPAFCKKVTNCHRFHFGKFSNVLQSQDHGQHNQEKWSILISAGIVDFTACSEHLQEPHQSKLQNPIFCLNKEHKTLYLRKTMGIPNL